MKEHIAAGKVVLITGAGSGIGAAAAQLAVTRGYRVVLADINGASIAALADRLGASAAFVELDVRDETSWSAAYDYAEAAFGPVDVLVNNAGIIHTGNAASLSMAQHRHMVEVNLIGTMTGVLTALPRMKARGSGHIIDVCSMTAFLPLVGYASYSGTKHAMRAFHHSVAIEERKSPITFSIIHPPSTRTPMLEQEMADPTSVIAFAEKSHSPEEVAKVIIDAILEKPIEVVFPPLAGRFQRMVGVFPRLMHFAIPLVEASGRRRRTKLLRNASVDA
jgi:NADP-dependent 3-hydroxy acid dehydrogenase YdfG